MRAGPDDPTRDIRQRRYEVAAQPMPIGECCRQIAVHQRARAVLMQRGEVSLARGAALLGSVAALWMAAVPSHDERETSLKVRGLRSFLGRTAEEDRAHLAPLIDAALAVENAGRMSSGRPPHGRRLSGWMDDVGASGAETGVPGGSATPGETQPDAVGFYAVAEAASDVDVMLDTAIQIVRDLIGLQILPLRHDQSQADPSAGSREGGARSVADLIKKAPPASWGARPGRFRRRMMAVTQRNASPWAHLRSGVLR